jgi:predicted transcriptional regulator
MSKPIGTSGRVTVRLPADMARTLDCLQMSGLIDLSAFVADAVSTKLRVSAAHAACDAWLRETGRPIPGPEEEAWARACYRLSEIGRYDLVQLLFDRAGKDDFRIDDLDLSAPTSDATKAA